MVEPSQRAMVGFDGVVRVLLHDMKGRRGVLVQHPRIGGRSVCRHLRRSPADGERTSEEGPASRQIPPCGEHDVDDLAVPVDRPLQAGPPPADLDVRVGSGRGAVSAFQLVRFLGPPAESNVPVPEHPALHKSVPLDQTVVLAGVVHGSGILLPR